MLAQLVANWADRVRSGERRAADRQYAGGRGSRSPTISARLIDDVITRKMDWQKLDGLVPDRFDKYWQFTLEFLKIARNYWPERLNEIGAIDAADRRDQLINAEMQRISPAAMQP